LIAVSEALPLPVEPTWTDPALPAHLDLIRHHGLVGYRTVDRHGTPIVPVPSRAGPLSVWEHHPSGLRLIEKDAATLPDSQALDQLIMAQPAGYVPTIRVAGKYYEVDLRPYGFRRLPTPLVERGPMDPGVHQTDERIRPQVRATLQRLNRLGLSYGYGHAHAGNILVDVRDHAVLIDAERLQLAPLTFEAIRSAFARGAQRFGMRNLAGVDLSGLPLAGVEALQQDLQWASLDRVNARGAWLPGALLEWATMVGADVTEAALPPAKLACAVLRQATFQRADLQMAVLAGADMTSADFTGANVAGATLTRAICREAIFTKANLAHATLEDTDLTGADLREIRQIEPRQLALAVLYQTGISNDLKDQLVAAFPPDAPQELLRTLAESGADPEGFLDRAVPAFAFTPDPSDPSA
jgi:uncharacterized protein YjbI with pentapeptide repeats